MANTKISNLTVGGSLTGTELVPIVQSGSTVRTTTQAIANLSSGTVIAEGTYSTMLALTGVSIGTLYIVTDIGPARSMWSYDGALWRPLGGSVLLYNLMSPVVGTATSTEQLLDQRTLPASLLAKNGDRLEIKISWEKSGTSETATARVRLGALGTSSDPAILQSSALFGTSRSVGTARAMRRVSATSMAALGGIATTVASSPASWGNAGGGTVSSNITVDTLTSSVYLTTSLQMSVGVEIPTLHSLSIFMVCA